MHVEPPSQNPPKTCRGRGPGTLYWAQSPLRLGVLGIPSTRYSEIHQERVVFAKFAESLRPLECSESPPQFLTGL